MLKKITFAAMVVLAALMVKADWLYWQVDVSEGVNASVSSFSAAAFYVEDGSGNKTMLFGPAWADDTDLATGDYTGTKISGPLEIDLSGYSTDQYTFFVEMLNYAAETESFTSAGEGYRWSYTELTSSGYTSAGRLDTPSFATGGLNMGSPTPEPTSGILILIGGAMLALRRRRQV